MAIQTAAVLKSYLESGDKPTQAQFIDLVDTIVASNIRTLKYTVGVAGTTGCNHLFTAPANTTEQVIQLGGTTIIPLSSWVLGISVVCTVGLNGAATGTVDIGSTSGGTEFGFTAIASDDTDIINTRHYANSITSNSQNLDPLSTSTNVARSVYFAYTPDTNWSSLTSGKWEVFVTFIDNSIL